MKKSSPPKVKGPSEAEIAKRNAAALARVEVMDDPDGLRNLMANAERMGVEPVRLAAFRRLAAVQSEGAAGSVENASWQMIHAIEQIKREAAGRTIRLSYLRRDIEKLGVVPAIDKLVSKPGASERYDELMARGMPDLTAEAVVLRFPDRFSPEAVARSQERLDAGAAAAAGADGDDRAA